MDTVLEKITLYDILGYVVPGSLIVLVGIDMAYPSKCHAVIRLCKTYSGLFLYVFTISSFLCGIMISEIGSMLFSFCKKRRGRVGNDSGFKYKSPVQQECVVEALKKAGIIKNPCCSVKIEEYFIYMYSDIQCDKAYNRIHNYASAEVMYKNLACAIVICSFMEGWRCLSDKAGCCCLSDKAEWHQIVVLIIICLFAVGIFINRYKRFKKKKEEYTVIWYVEKYMGKDLKDNGNTQP